MRFALSFALFALLAVPLGGSTAKASVQACSLLFVKSAELDYLAAKTPLERAERRKKYFTLLEEIGESRLGISPENIQANQLSTAWWNIAFFRSGIEVDARELSVKDLRVLLESPERALYLETLGTAYKIADFRKNMVYRLNESLDSFSKWRDAATTDVLPGHLQKAIDILEKKTKPSREWVAARARGVGDQIRKVKGRLPSSFAARASVSNAERAKSLSLYSVLKLRDGLFTIANFASPVSLSFVLPEAWMHKTAPIFKKLERNFKYTPNAEELALLKKYRAVSVFEARKLALEKNPTWFKSMHVLKSTSQWASFVGFSLAIGAGYIQSVHGDGTVDLETFLTDPKYAPKAGDVQLINETLPFPHLTLRIGDTVYSYGTDTVTAIPVDVYLREHPKRMPKGIFGFLAQERSVQVATLRLGDAATQKLESEFKDAVGKPYAKRELVSENAVRVIRALEASSEIRIPNVVGATPSAIVLYLATERIGGSSDVSSVRLVTMEKMENTTLPLLRSIWANAREVRAWTNPKLFVVNRIMQWQIDSKTDPVVYDFALHKDRISKDPEYEKNVAATFLERYEEGIASLEHSAVEPEELLETFYRLQVYSEAEHELLGTRSFDFQKVLSDRELSDEIRSTMESFRPVSASVSH